MAYNLQAHKIASGTVPWTNLYHSYVQDVQDALNTLDALMTSANLTLTSHAGQIFTNNANIGNNDVDISNIRTDIGNNDAEIAGILTSIANILTAIGNNDTDIANILTAIGSNDTDIANILTAIGSNDTEIAGILTSIANILTAIGNNDTDIGTLNTTTGDLSTSVTDINNWQVALDAISTYNIPLVTWVQVIEEVVKNSFDYTYVSKILDFRTRVEGLKSYANLTERLDDIQIRVDFIQDFMKQSGINYLDESLNVVPATTPNP